MIELVDATRTLIDAAIADQSELGKLLNAVVAPEWEGFPEALPVLRELPASTWGSKLFVLTSPRTLVGLGGYKGPPQDGMVEIGYAIAPSFQRRGLATAVARQLVDAAFASGVRRVDAHTLGEHNASGRVLEKVGMHRVGELHDPEHGVIWHWRISR